MWVLGQSILVTLVSFVRETLYLFIYASRKRGDHKLNESKSSYPVTKTMMTSYVPGPIISTHVSLERLYR